MANWLPEDQSLEGIAIIGMAGRFPGAKNIEQFWQNLRDGVESISFFSDEELKAAGVASELLNDPNYVKAGAILEDIEMFDASFFGFAPSQAKVLDPQQRILLECAWEALENAGYDSERYKGRIGVYAGAGLSVYLYRHLIPDRDLMLPVDMPIETGNDKDYLPTRISYLLNLRGPSLNVNTACSTSLVAVHLACQSLLDQESDMALAGAVSIMLPHKAGYLYQEGQIVSPDGHCRPFDANAQGTILGNGAGLVLLKRLEDALADGDYIYAVIRGTAINNDGGLKVGYTAPSVAGQAEVIAEALAIAEVAAETIGYIEAHGTATPMGDPIEIAALTQAFRASTDKKGFAAIGSVKSNVGHLNRAAGVAGLIKTALALKHGLIPPSLHFERPNPQIDLANSPFYVNTTLREWHSDGPRRAGISSFGVGGTNAHAVLEEAPTREPSSHARRWQLLLLSAKSEAALFAATSNLATYLKQHPELDLADVAYTLQVGRRTFSHRRMLVCRHLQEASDRLAVAVELPSATSLPKVRPSVVFMFPGQGAQYVNMAKELYEVEPTFREVVDSCSELLTPHLGLDLREVLYPRAESAEASHLSHLLRQTRLTQPALFVIEYALARLLLSWGIEPEAMIGHSIGEYVAACIAGVLSMPDALALVAARGRLMQQLPSGRMLAVFLPFKEVQSLLSGQIELAASNAPSLCVVSGPTDQIERLQKELTILGIDSRPLQTSHAFHSSMMEPILDAFTELVSHVVLSPPQIPYLSNVTGRWITAAEATEPTYWAKHLRQAVRFAEGIGELLEEPTRILLEVGPRRTLSKLAQRQKAAEGRLILSSQTNLGEGEGETLQKSDIFVREKSAGASPKVGRGVRGEGRGDVEALLKAVGQLWQAGVEIDWEAFYAHQRRQRLPLPTYPWERQRYWVEAPRKPSPPIPPMLGGRHPFLQERLYLAGSKEIRFDSQIGADYPSYLTHHRVYGEVVLPATAYLEMALAAGARVLKQPLVLEEVLIQQALILPESGRDLQTIQLILRPSNSQDSVAGAERQQWQIYAADREVLEDASWTLHASGYLLAGQPAMASRVDLASLLGEMSEKIDVEAYYQSCREKGLDYGPSFQAIEQLWRSGEGWGEGEALGQIRLPESFLFTPPLAESPSYQLHPVLLDACLQVLGATFYDKPDTYMPLFFTRLTLFAPSSNRLWSHAQLRSTGKELLTADLRFFAPEGQLVATVEGLQLKRATRSALMSDTPSVSKGPAAWQGLSRGTRDWLYEVKWQPQVCFLPPEYFPTPEAVASSLESELSQFMAPSTGSGQGPPPLSGYSEFLSQLESLSVAYVGQAFQKLGFRFSLGQRFSTAELATQLGIVESYQRLLNRLLEMLAEVGTLRQRGRRHQNVGAIQPSPQETEWEVIQDGYHAPPLSLRRLLEKYPSHEAELIFLARCGEQLAEVLRGTADPLQLLFPEGDLTTAARLYQESPAFQVMNRLVREVILKLVEGLPPYRGVRILEIGAGTGGTSASLLPHLPANQTDYLFTNIGALFIAKAQEKFADYAFVRYQTLDIEQEPAAAHQGQYDLILAANVLHATKDLRQTLKHIHQMLLPGGMLVLLEGTARQRWVDLTFGLTEDWWRFTDHDLRPDYPLLTPTAWQEVLRSVGFDNPVTLSPLLEQAVIVARKAQAPAMKIKRNWLIFGDRSGIGAQLATRIEEKGDVATLVYPNVDDQSTAASQIIKINPVSKAQVQRIVAAHQWYGVVHLWSLDSTVGELGVGSLWVRKGNRKGKGKGLPLHGGGQPPEIAPTLDPASQRGCGSTLLLLQELLKAGSEAKLWLVTQGAQAVGTSPLTGVAQSSLWGMGKVIALEHPDLNCVRVDLDPNAAPQRAAQWLLDELYLMPHDSRPAEDQVAFREQSRYVARLARYSPAPPASPPESPPELGGIEGGRGQGKLRAFSAANDSSTLITGGLGGLGLLVARFLAEHGARHLVLIGRSKASPSVDAQIKEIEEAGARVVVAQCDVTKKKQLAQLLTEIEPPLKGVIHAAGLLDDGILEQQTLSRFAKVMAPKVQGAWHLHTLTKNMPLDFFVLFSSVASLLGSKGQANHAAANAFLDGLAFYRSSQGLPALAINWGGWSEIGIAAHLESRFSRQGIKMIAPEQGLQVLEQLFLESAPVQMGVVPINWSLFPRRPFTSRLASKEKAPPVRPCRGNALRLPMPEAAYLSSGLPAGQKLIDELKSLPLEERRPLLEAHIRSEVADVLGQPRHTLALSQGFFELGMDSLTTIELRNRLQNRLGCKLPSTLAFDYPTVDALVDYLVLLSRPSDEATANFDSESSVETDFSSRKERVEVELETLSDHEAEALLLSKLEQLNF